MCNNLCQPGQIKKSLTWDQDAKRKQCSYTDVGTTHVGNEVQSTWVRSYRLVKSTHLSNASFLRQAICWSKGTIYASSTGRFGLQAGLDSLGAVELRNAISGEFSLSVPATLAFDYPTAAALADFIISEVQQSSTELPVRHDLSTSRNVDGSQETSEVLAIGCRYPGGAKGKFLISLSCTVFV